MKLKQWLCEDGEWRTTDELRYSDVRPTWFRDELKFGAAFDFDFKVRYVEV